MTRRTTTSLLFWALTVTCALEFAGQSCALPIGRAWTPMDTTFMPGHNRLFPDRLEVDSLGRLVLFAESAGGVGYDAGVLRWAGTSWEWVVGLGYGTAYWNPTISTGRPFPLIWQTIDQIWVPGTRYLSAYVVAASFDGERIVDVDTVALAFAGHFGYSAAASSRRRWVTKIDYPDTLLAWYSETLHSWNPIDLSANALGASVAPLNDTTAILVLQNRPGPSRWGLISGNQWIDMGLLPREDPYRTGAGMFFHAAPGGYWLGLVTDDSYVEMLRYRDGSWSRAESLTCRQRMPGHMISQNMGVSRDPWHDRPVVAWLQYNSDHGYAGELCVCVPDPTGYPIAESLPIEADPWDLDTIQDQNDDVWVVWQEQYWGMYWTHSYVRATAGAPQAVYGGTHPTVRWSLSEPAPGSYWAVLRAVGDGEFGQVARVRADSTTSLAWVDTEATAAPLVRYRIRRECVDRRYELTSAEGVWMPAQRLQLLPPSPKPVEGALELNVYGAPPGALVTRAYDVQGREVAKLHVYASGSGLDRVRFALEGPAGRLPSAIYFVRVTDARGNETEAVKVALIR